MVRCEPRCLCEPLEQRVMLATVFWDGGAATTSWHDAANWSGDTLPGAADDVVIEVIGSDPTIEHSDPVLTTVRSIVSKEPISLSGGTVSVSDGWSQWRKLTVSAGATIDGAGDLAIKDELTWTGGTMQGAGRTMIVPGAAAWIQGDVSLGRTLTNHGTLHWTSGSPGVDGVINNQATMSFTSTGTIDGSGIVANNAMLVEDQADGSTVGVTFRNSGDVQVDDGTLVLGGGATFYSGSVTFNVAWTSLAFSGPSSTMHAGVTVSGDGVLDYQAGVNTINGSVDGIKELNVSGLLHLNGDQDVQRGFWLGGTVKVYDTVSFDDVFSASGTVNGPGMVQVLAGASGTFHDGAQFGVDVVNDGTLWFVSNVRPFDMTLTNNGVLNSFTTVDALSGTSLLINMGTVLGTNSAVESDTGIFFIENHGTITTGPSTTFQIFDGGLSDGTIAPHATGNVAIGGDPFYLDGMVTGAGRVTIRGKVHWTGGAIDISTLWINTPGVLTMLTPGSRSFAPGFASISGDLNWSDGTLTFSPGLARVNTGGFVRLNGATHPVFEDAGLTIRPGGTLLKSGSLAIDAGTSLTLFNDRGLIRVIGGELAIDASRVSNITPERLKLGVWRVENGSSLRIYNATVSQFQQATAILSGAGSTFSILEDLDRNAGTIIVRDEAQLNVTPMGGTFLNDDELRLEPSGSITIDGDFDAGAFSKLHIGVSFGAGVTFGSINVDDDATIAAALEVAFAGTPAGPVDLTFLSASSISGSWPQVEFLNTPAGYDASVLIDPMTASIVLD